MEISMNKVNNRKINRWSIGYVFRVLFLVIILFNLSPFSLSDESYVKSKEVLNKEYAMACEEALNVIRAVNEDKLDVHIGDNFYVVDVEGKLEGYSMGYYVGNKPYGYAIYSVEYGEIREFVFQENVNNIYLELEKIAITDEEIDENNLVKSVVFDGGIEYILIDREGEMVVSDEIFEETTEETTEQLEGVLDDYNDDNIDIEAIVNSEYNKNFNTSLKRETMGIASQYYGTDTDYWDLNCNSGDIYNCIPEWKQVMVNQNYYIKNAKKYCCEVSSGVGCLNWMGVLVNSSLVDTYNYIWSFCKMSTELNVKADEKNNLPAYAYQGLSDYDLARALNSLFVNNGVSTRAKSIVRPSFAQLAECIDRSDIKESHPTVLSIGGYSYINGKEEYSGHSTIVTSYIQKKKINKNGYDHYIGINQNWYGGEGRLSDAESTFELIRYLNYDNLMNEENIEVGGVLFNNLSSRNIKEANVSYASSKTIEIACCVPAGTKYVYFPTWTNNNGQNDVIWHSGTLSYGTIATVSINTADYNNKEGLYITHIYAYDANMNMLACYGTLYTNIESGITNITAKRKSNTSYEVTCKLPTGTTDVYFPTWTYDNGQDDIIWYKGEVQGNTGRIVIDSSRHNYEKGWYVTHIYAYDRSGNTLNSAGVHVKL